MVGRATKFFWVVAFSCTKVLHVVWGFFMSALIQMPEKLHEKEK